LPEASGPAGAVHRAVTGKLVIATHNPGKLREIAELIRPFGVTVLSASALGLPEPDETGATFEANAALKARAAAEGARLPALADDSGLVVPALGGDPGIYSARWAGPDKNFMIAMRRIKDALAGKADRRASFVAVLALAWPDGHVESFRGEVHGSLIWPPRGILGFGYDPIFLPAGRDLTFGEMDQSEKHRISHRAAAFRQLVAACFSRRQ
jgi:XTP/dITP diphosphohydrolase